MVFREGAENGTRGRVRSPLQLDRYSLDFGLLPPPGSVSGERERCGHRLLLQSKSPQPIPRRLEQEFLQRDSLAADQQLALRLEPLGKRLHPGQRSHQARHATHAQVAAMPSQPASRRSAAIRVSY